MAKGINVQQSGINEAIRQLEAVSDITPFAKMAIYDGAGIVAETMQSQVTSLKTSKNFAKGDKKRYALPEDVKALKEHLGIAKMKSDLDKINTKVGFEGYFKGRTKVDVAIQKVANSINSGTSFMYAQPFIKRTIKGSEAQCVDAMSSSIDKSLAKITK